MESSTKILRRMLDERGVEWGANDTYRLLVTSWKDASGHSWAFTEHKDGSFSKLTAYHLTPEQAIAATLGAEDKVYAVGGIIAQAECHDVCNSAAEFTCSACGFNCDITSWISLFDGDVGRHRHHHHGTPNYCPNCGRRVVP